MTTITLTGRATADPELSAWDEYLRTDVRYTKSGPKRCWKHRPGLTHQLDSGERGLAMKATRCSVDECSNGGRLRRGLCQMHYARLLRHGDVGGPDKQHAASWAGKACSVADCGNDVLARGYCRAHYKRLRRYGSTTGTPRVETIDEYFARNVEVASPPKSRPGLGPCHEWTGTIANTGYGYARYARKSYLAHRLALALAGADLPDDLVVDHLCRNRACVNPDHLEPVTNRENLRRGWGYRLRNGMSDSCIRGHLYTAENTYINPNDRTDRRCVACAQIREQSRRKSA